MVLTSSTDIRSLGEIELCASAEVQNCGRWCHKICKFAAEIFQNIKNWLLNLCQIFHMVTIEIVINSTHIYEHMCVTISCQYALSRLGQCSVF